MNNLKNRIVEALLHLSTPRLIEVWNDYTREAYYEDIVYDMGMFNDEFQYDSPMEIARKIWSGDFNPNDRYYTFNGYGNLVSFDYCGEENSPVDLDCLADWMIHDNNAMGVDEVQEILDEDDEDEENPAA